GLHAGADDHVQILTAGNNELAALHVGAERLLAVVTNLGDGSTVTDRCRREGGGLTGLVQLETIDAVCRNERTRRGDLETEDVNVLVLRAEVQAQDGITKRAAKELAGTD